MKSERSEFSFDDGMMDIDRDNTKNIATSKQGNARRGFLILAMLVIAVVIILVFFLYYVHFGPGKHEVTFVISSQELTQGEKEQDTSPFVAGGRVYFTYERDEPMNADRAVIDIEFFQDKNYRHYRSITYEMDRDFARLSSYIPGVYFKRQGKYRIKGLLDGKLVSDYKIVIE